MPTYWPYTIMIFTHETANQVEVVLLDNSITLSFIVGFTLQYHLNYFSSTRNYIIINVIVI